MWKWERAAGHETFRGLSEVTSLLVSMGRSQTLCSEQQLASPGGLSKLVSLMQGCHHLEANSCGPVEGKPCPGRLGIWCLLPQLPILLCSLLRPTAGSGGSAPPTHPVHAVHYHQSESEDSCRGPDLPRELRPLRRWPAEGGSGEDLRKQMTAHWAHECLCARRQPADWGCEVLEVLFQFLEEMSRWS